MATLAHNLDVRRAAAEHCYPGVVVGWIGNQAHQAEASDHNPDSRGIVHAIDVMLSVGPKATAVLNWCLAHPADLEYLIHNDRIYRRSHGFANESYKAVDPGRTDKHTNHVHISGRHGTVGKNTATGTGYDVAAEKLTPTGTPCTSTTHPSAPAAPPEEEMTPAQLAELLATLNALPAAIAKAVVGQVLGSGPITVGQVWQSQRSQLDAIVANTNPPAPPPAAPAS